MGKCTERLSFQPPCFPPPSSSHFQRPIVSFHPRWLEVICFPRGLLSRPTVYPSASKALLLLPPAFTSWVYLVKNKKTNGFFGWSWCGFKGMKFSECVLSISVAVVSLFVLCESASFDDAKSKASGPLWNAFEPDTLPPFVFAERPVGSHVILTFKKTQLKMEFCMKGGPPRWF